MEASLLIELLTEELPPKSLQRLAAAFADQLAAEIARHRLADKNDARRIFATPRRLAVLMPAVRAQGLATSHAVDGPLASNVKAVEGFARKHKLSPDTLERTRTDKGDIVVARYTSPGVSLDEALAKTVEAVLKKLPVAKLMRWGSGEAQFVRPVHGLVMLHGSRVVPGEVLGLPSGRHTRGHRFMGKGDIELSNAEAYESRLLEAGFVVADFDQRRAEIKRLLESEARRLDARLGANEDLLDEVTALVEYPVVYAGEFEREFLEVPPECLILTMKQNQKYFPLFDAGGALLPRFLIVSNMRVADPGPIVRGNERVVRPRLADARFFYEQDRKLRLESRVPQLTHVVYHNQLGSQLERVERIELLAGRIARDLGVDPVLTERAAHLAKADLLTGMVGEFPELQGTMGRYYALHDGEPRAVADAIAAHYQPRFAGDTLPEDGIACAVALADKLDALAGLFGIGQQPSGEKDPFGLRRAAIGVVRILAERSYPLALHELLTAAFAPYPAARKDAMDKLEAFAFERFAGYLKDRGHAALEIDAVLGLRPARLDLVPPKLTAVRAFLELPEAESLAAANKRIRNILQKSPPAGEGGFSEARLVENAERELYRAYMRVDADAAAKLEEQRFTDALTVLAALKAPVDAFFDNVMVNVDDPALRNNRLLLLMRLQDAMNRVADISRLAV